MNCVHQREPKITISCILYLHVVNLNCGISNLIIIFSPTTLVIELLHICDEITTKSWVDDHIQNSHSNVKPPSSRNTEFLARIFCVGFDVYRLDCHTVRTLELAHHTNNVELPSRLHTLVHLHEVIIFQFK